MVEAVRAAGATVEAHDDHFAQDVADEVWLAVVGARGWIALSKDGRIRHRALEVTALRAAKVRAFLLRDGNAAGKDMAAIFVRHLPRIREIALTTPAPFIARVLASRVEVIGGG